jgi:hypothetical protein
MLQLFFSLTGNRSIVPDHRLRAPLTGGPGIKKIRNDPGSSFGCRGFRLTIKSESKGLTLYFYVLRVGGKRLFQGINEAGLNGFDHLPQFSVKIERIVLPGDLMTVKKPS